MRGQEEGRGGEGRVVMLLPSAVPAAVRTASMSKGRLAPIVLIAAGVARATTATCDLHQPCWFGACRSCCGLLSL